MKKSLFAILSYLHHHVIYSIICILTTSIGTYRSRCPLQRPLPSSHRQPAGTARPPQGRCGHHWAQAQHPADRGSWTASVHCVQCDCHQTPANGHQGSDPHSWCRHQQLPLLHNTRNLVSNTIENTMIYVCITYLHCCWKHPGHSIHTCNCTYSTPHLGTARSWADDVQWQSPSASALWWRLPSAASHHPQRNQ